MSLLLLAVGRAVAHPMGNFSISHYARLKAGPDRLTINYALDVAEIPTVTERTVMDTDHDGAISDAERHAYVERKVSELRDGLQVDIDARSVPLQTVAGGLDVRKGAGGLETLFLAADFTAPLPSPHAGAVYRVEYRDNNLPDRTGWKEVIAVAEAGAGLRDSTVPAADRSQGLTVYPTDPAFPPPQVTEASFTITVLGGSAAAGVSRQPPFVSRSDPPFPSLSPPRTLGSTDAERETKDPNTQSRTPNDPTTQRRPEGTRDPFTRAIALRQLTPGLILLSLLLAFLWGGGHALTPGHGKTVVAAYLVGSRGTPRHALFLGAVVTLTHTFGVFALGLVTLFASRWIVPERLYPAITLLSGAAIAVVGAALLRQRLRALFATKDGGRKTEDGRTAASVLRLPSSVTTHDHGDGRHHHHVLPDEVSFRSLLALGISGGALPCPSALVVMLGAISLHRVAFGLLLILCFSLGLATVLTAVGLAFVYTGRLFARPLARWPFLRFLPAASALVVTAIGIALCVQALPGINLGGVGSSTAATGSLPILSLLGLGLIFGLKHALEADHLAAVSTLVSERRSIPGAMLVGGLWGLGHTLSLLIAGVAVILLHLHIGARLAMALEFCVALMLVGLGVNALLKLRRGGTLHVHPHQHGGVVHLHPHLHEPLTRDEPHAHHGWRPGARPLVVGMIHGMAGSAALMLLVLTTIPSPAVGFAYIAVFGIGSIGGMMGMSALVSLPLQVAAARFARAHLATRLLAGGFSLALGLTMAYQIGVVDGLFR
jgi:ABC-type nickel/cobalt efflux system permease component RcnA